MDKITIDKSENIIHGPRFDQIPDISLGKFIYNKLSTRTGNNVALVDAVTEASITYKEFFNKSRHLAESLLISGCKNEAIIGLCSENNLEFLVVVLGALFINATIAPISNNYTQDELRHCLNLTRPSIIFCSAQVQENLNKLKNDLDFIKKIVIIDGGVDYTNCDDTLDNFINSNRSVLLSSQSPSVLADKLEQRINPNDQMAFILLSSGTTGLPKGVMITHTNVLTGIINMTYFWKHFSGDNSILGLIPFFHIYGLVTMLSSIIDDKMIVVFKRFDERLFLRSIEKYRISTLVLVPPLLVLLAKSSLVDRYDLSSVKEVMCGAAATSPHIEQLFMKRFNLSSIRQGYGLTEALIVAILRQGDKKTGSCGQPNPYISIKIKDVSTGKSMGMKEIGEICCRGLLIMKGYYNNPQATRECLSTDGWLSTGDLGYYDEEGYLFIMGRLKELIKYKGFQVAPVELEAILLQMSQIKDAAVVGLPDEMAGQLPVAFVVKTDDDAGANLTEKNVQQFVAERVSPQKKLRGGVIFTTSIPKNASGKILRQELTKQLLAKHKQS